MRGIYARDDQRRAVGVDGLRFTGGIDLHRGHGRRCGINLAHRRALRHRVVSCHVVGVHATVREVNRIARRACSVRYLSGVLDVQRDKVGAATRHCVDVNRAGSGIRVRAGHNRVVADRDFADGVAEGGVVVDRAAAR